MPTEVHDVKLSDWLEDHKEEFEFDDKQFEEFFLHKPKLVKIYLNLKNKGVKKTYASEFTSEYSTLDDITEFVIKGLSEKNIKVILTKKDSKGILGFLHFRQV